jgi:precorrin-2 dehydrogenase/sirohydrochlorin ferrochelatase
MNRQQSALFAIFLKLDGRPCLVAGGGAIAEGKIASLLRSGARVTVVSPELTPALLQHAHRDEIRWESRGFQVGDLDGIFLVVAATSSCETNALVYREADRRGILCNAVDQPQECHFYYPAVVDRGALQIAISTTGLSPSLAQRLRKELEVSNFESRRRILGRLASREVFDRLEAARGRELERGEDAA